MPPNDADDFQETERSINRILHSDLSAADLVPAERIEEFTPLGLLNLPDVEVTFSGTYDATPSRTLHQILFDHRATDGASALEITELEAELQPLLLEAVDRITRPLMAAKEANALVLADARRLRADAQRESWVGWAEEYSSESKDAIRAGERWDEQNPGLAALLRAVDGG